MKDQPKEAKRQMKVKRQYPGLYYVSHGNREIRIMRHTECPKVNRWWVHEDSRVNGLIDACSTYAEAKQAAIAELTNQERKP